MFVELGSKNIKNLGFREGWAFIGVRGLKKSAEKRGKQAATSMVIGYGKISRKEVKKTVRTKVEPVKGGSRIEVQSAASKHGNYVHINIQGNIIVDEKKSTGNDGLNVVALEPFKHEMILNTSYNTAKDEGASKRFIKDFKKLPKASIIVIGCKGDCSKKLSGTARQVLQALGSEEIVNLGFDQGYVFIGVKGQVKFLEKRGDLVGTGAILSYAVVERKKEKRTKVDGGSSIEIVSAGLRDGNVGKVILNGKELFTTMNLETAAKMKDATMSSNYRKSDAAKDAALALDDTPNKKSFFHTKCGSDEWWSAQFAERMLVTEVKIQNRQTGGDNTIRRLQKSEITVEGQYCG